MNTKSPRFKTVEERREAKFNSDDRKFSPKSDRLSLRRNLNKSDYTKPNETIYPTEAKKAGREGSVKISVKSEKIAEKKTGPLSPRAPEKIRHNRATEMKVYGENACYAVFQQRPEAIVRLWATVEGAKKAGDLLSYLAEQKKAYHVVDSEEMERVTGTEHHSGICLLIKKPTPFTLEGYLQIPRQRDCLVLLDSVNNAQNIGGIVRTCAFYGVTGMIVENHDILNSANTARVAEGGLEFVHALETKHTPIALEQLRQAGYQIVHITRQKQATSLKKAELSEKLVFVLSEVVGQEIAFPEDTNVQLSFANPLNSGLNVAVNAGILLSQWYQCHLL